MRIPREFFLGTRFAARKMGNDEIQQIFADSLEEDAPLFNEYHALIVETAKQFCRKVLFATPVRLGIGIDDTALLIAMV